MLRSRAAIFPAVAALLVASCWALRGSAGASQVEATRQAVISAQSSLDATQAGYEVGTRTIVDVLISQQQLSRQRVWQGAAAENS